MSLGDVLPALQQGAIDGAVASTAVFTAFHYQDAAKYVTETGQPAIFGIVEISKKWYDTLPADLQQIVDQTAAREDVAINPQADQITENSRKAWTDSGGELIKLPPDDQSSLLELLSSVGADVSKQKPLLSEAYKVVAEAAVRTR
jgi:TRAP-type C4-dicarboxylate transport system substrate-binding protein